MSEYEDVGPVNLCGPHLKRLRLQQRLTLDDIQAGLKRDYGLALSCTDLERIERAERTVLDGELWALAHLLGISLEELVWGGETPSDARAFRERLKELR
jgi:hypothetical protein